MKSGSRTAMDVLVTGATGFVGANVARLPVADGYRVRVLARPASSLRALEGCPVEVLRGDILQPDAVARTLEGCARVFHVAADYRLWARDPGEIYRNNVDGTRTVLEACARAGVERVIYTSSVGALGLPQDGAPGTETTPITLDDMIGHYKRSKFLAERGEPLELTCEMRRLTQEIIIRACCGEVPAAEVEAVRLALDMAVAHVEHRLWNPLGWLAVPTPAGARYRRALATLEAFASCMVSEARRSTPPPNTLLGALLNVPTGAESLTTAELRDELTAFLVAGHTTTASALAWTWSMLSENPDALDRLEDECRTVLRGRVPGIDDLSGLGYTRRVIEEVLRLYPPTWLTARTPVEDDTLGGYLIPRGALALVSPYLTHRHPAVWEEPERFDPDRFTPACGAARPAFAYFPFGGGPRRCIGGSFAITEMQLIVAALAQRYRFTLLPGARIIPAASLTLRPRPPVLAQLHRARG